MRRALLLASTTAAIAACTSSSLDAECRLNSDCPVAQICSSGRCLVACKVDRDCTRASDVCRGGQCVERDPSARVCATASDCAQGETCEGGVCGAVRFVPSDGGAPPATDAGGLLPYGAMCLHGSECASTLCLALEGAGTGHCTHPCTSDQDCAYPDRCDDVTGAGKLCGPMLSGKATGDPCPNGASDCGTGLCLNVPQSGPICTQKCTPLPNCPSGLTCTPIPDGNGGAIAVCAPGTGKGFGDACGAGSQCASMLCVAVGGGSSGICTAPCDSTPCPSGWTCASVDDGTGRSVSICAPEGQSGGAPGASCTGASSCASGLCLSDDRTHSSVCTIACSSNADCASLGFICGILTTGQAVCAPP